jgi:hypothetical protein
MLSTIPELGSAGFGLVWGWLIGFHRYARRPWWAVLAIIASSLVAGLEVYWVCGLVEAGHYCVAALFGLTLHLAWISYLRQRVSSGY